MRKSGDPDQCFPDLNGGQVTWGVSRCWVPIRWVYGGYLRAHVTTQTLHSRRQRQYCQAVSLTSSSEVPNWP